MKKICFLLFFIAVLPINARAIPSLHPIELYEIGDGLIRTAETDSGNLLRAQQIFSDLIQKYPDSPFGYLGMSRIYRIDACHGKELYDLQQIESIAFPYALKALKLGPSIREVHENYAFFERFFQDHLKSNP